MFSTSGIHGIWFHKSCITSIEFHDFEDVSIKFLQSWIIGVESRKSRLILFYKLRIVRVGSNAAKLAAIDFHETHDHRDLYPEESSVFDIR